MRSSSCGYFKLIGTDVVYMSVSNTFLVTHFNNVLLHDYEMFIPSSC